MCYVHVLPFAVILYFVKSYKMIYCVVAKGGGDVATVAMSFVAFIMHVRLQLRHKIVKCLTFRLGIR